MGSLGTTQLISLVVGLAAVAASGGFVASTVARRNKRRARGYFLVGFFCGLLAGGILHRRRRALNALGAIARLLDVCPRPAGIRRGTVRFAARTLSFAAIHARPAFSSQWPRQLRM
jgi:hypothetical protein